MLPYRYTNKTIDTTAIVSYNNNMITIKEGNYHTLAEVAAKLHTNRMRISRIAKAHGLGLRLGRLSVRLHDDDVKKIASFL